MSIRAELDLAIVVRPGAMLNPNRLIAFRNILYRLLEEAEHVACLSDIWKIKLSDKVSVDKALDLWPFAPFPSLWFYHIVYGMGYLL